MRKVGIWLLGMVFLLFAAIGIRERANHKNVLRDYMQTGDSGKFITGVFDIERKDLLEYERDYYESADLIVKAELSGMPQSCFGCTKVPLRILDIYRGEGLEKGDEIQYISNISYLRKDKALDGVLVNFMKEDTPYLVFLNVPGIAYSQKNIYLAPELSLFPYFALEETENVYDEEEWRRMGGVNYVKTLQGNEFFVNNQEALDCMLDFKKEILETYITN